MKRKIDVITRKNIGVSLARLYSGNLSQAEALAISERADRDGAFRRDYLVSLELLADMDQLANDPDIQAIANEPKGKGRTLVNWPVSSVAAGLLLAFAVGVFNVIGPHVQESSDVKIQRYVTRIGEQKTVTLKDGSVITLNTGTQLTVEINAESRRVGLERGEAYFDVVPDAEKPFTVELGARTVTVLGTRFNIRKQPERYQIAVMEGVVAIHKSEEEPLVKSPLLSASDDTPVRLQAPKQRRVAAGWIADFDVELNQLVGYKAKQMDQLYGWRTGLIRFYKEPLYKVVQELNRYSGKKILIEDTSIMDLRVYAAVNINELNGALNALERLLPIKVTSYFDRIVIVGE